MVEYLKTWLQLKNDRRGVTMLEYAILGAMVAAILVLAVPKLTGAISGAFTGFSSDVTGASTAVNAS